MEALDIWDVASQEPLENFRKEDGEADHRSWWGFGGMRGIQTST